MYFTKSTILHTALFAGTLSVAIPAPERPVTSHNAIAKRANPTIGKSAIAKRETPRIGDGIDTSNPFQGGKLVSPSGTSSGAFATAMELIYYANTATGARNDAVFAKYFNPGDRQNVTLIFDRLLGPDGVSGAEALVNIQVISGEEEPGDPAPAALEGYEYEDPNLVLTDDAFVYPNRDDNINACSNWSEEGMTQDMYLLGSIILHEYVHWDWFLGSIHRGQVIDQPNGYGWEGARALDKSLAIYNADSYGWYATELFWAVICGVEGGYNAPGAEKRTK